MVDLTEDEMKTMVLGHCANAETEIRRGNFFAAKSEAQMMVDLLTIWKASR